ncbi:MAG: hypothetical protein LC677_06705 [Halomonas sp.]|nr:hypothetical protein [Halomonas sp.]
MISVYREHPVSIPEIALPSGQPHCVFCLRIPADVTDLRTGFDELDEEGGESAFLIALSHMVEA